MIKIPYYYAQDSNFSKESNQLPDKYLNQIICADCLSTLKELPDNCIDLILTSPPYNFGMDYNQYEDTINWDDYYKNLFTIFDECIRVLKWGGRIVVNVQPLYNILGKKTALLYAVQMNCHNLIQLNNCTSSIDVYVRNAQK